MPKSPEPKVITKKHLARVERERIQRRFLLFGMGIVVIAVIGLIVFGILDQTVLFQYKPVAIVNGTKITVGEFQRQYQYERLNAVQTGLETTEETGQRVLSRLIDDTLIAAKAKELGIQLTDSDLQKFYQDSFGFYPQGTPTSIPVEVLLPTSTLSALQKTLVATENPSFTSTSAPVITDATATESLSPTATEGSPVVSETLTETPISGTPTEYTNDLYNKDLASYFKSMESLGISKDILEDFFRSYLLKQKVLDNVTAETPIQEEMIWARQILVSDEKIAAEIYQLLSSGTKWAEIVSKYDVDGTKSRDIGWIRRDQVNADLADAMFKLDIGQISEPVITEYGYQVVQILGKETRTLTESQLTQAKAAAFDELLQKLRESATIIENDILSYLPVEPTQISN